MLTRVDPPQRAVQLYGVGRAAAAQLRGEADLIRLAIMQGLGGRQKEKERKEVSSDS